MGAQITALGLVFNLLSQGAVSLTMGMVIGTLVVLVYTLYGGMWSVALTDFVQMIVIAAGLLAIAWFAADLAGGADKVVAYAASEGQVQLPAHRRPEGMVFFAAGITMMLGPIPQRDVFQRDVLARPRPPCGPVIGGAVAVHRFSPSCPCSSSWPPGGDARDAAWLLADDPQKVLDAGDGSHAAAAAGGLLRRAAVAIMSTLGHRCWRRPPPSSRTSCATCDRAWRCRNDAEGHARQRAGVHLCVLTYSITMEGSSIYELVSGAYQVPLVGARAAGVRRLLAGAPPPGALLAVVMGIGCGCCSSPVRC